MASVPLTQGQVALVDDADLPLVAGRKWCARYDGKRWYALSDGGRTYMHRVILGLQKGDGQRVDHVSGDGLDNRRQNLRLATQPQNLANSGARSGRYKGVSRHGDRWQAQIKVNGHNRGLGRFTSPEDAARAYDQAAREAWGDFARTNFPKE